MTTDNCELKLNNLSINISGKEIVKSVSLPFYKNKVTSIMGPSGCGKTTLIRTINRLNEAVEFEISGQIFFDNEDLLSMNPIVVRRRIGMVFQRPNPFPSMSIFDNVISGYMLNGIKLDKNEKETIVEECLTKVGLYEEVKFDLHRKDSNKKSLVQNSIKFFRHIFDLIFSKFYDRQRVPLK